MHDEWFQQSTNGIHIETSRSGHHIHDEEPRLVVGAIWFVLDRARAALTHELTVGEAGDRLRRCGPLEDRNST